MIKNLNWSRSTLDLIWWWAKGSVIVTITNPLARILFDTFRHVVARARILLDEAALGNAFKTVMHSVKHPQAHPGHAEHF